MRSLLLSMCIFIVSYHSVFSQDYRWQQRVEYTMDVMLDVRTHKVKGTQKLLYTNNSKDTLTKVYYHLFFNAFQPGSMMDVRSRTISDPDPRVASRIAKLSESEMGYQQIKSLKQDGKNITWRIDGTVMEVTLQKGLLPNSKTTFDMEFESQIPIQIRRSGRNSKEGIAYSMTQWYPKIAEYDYQGWHAYQYVAREFQGVWGDFDVKITLDPTYIIGGTGILQNGDKIGYGYEKAGATPVRSKENLTWHFIAKNVIDFAFAADPDYVHDIVKVTNGPLLHFFYQNDAAIIANWKEMQKYAVMHFEFMNKTFGKYPYETYSIIQGGDGGMEYPMCTLITGGRSLGSLVGVMAHEVAHSWYQGVLATNEALYPWIDEGFTDFASQESEAYMYDNADNAKVHSGSYDAYFSLVKSGLQEPISQHSDHYNTNRAYGTAAYAMGTVFLNQLKYIVGDDVFYKGMRNYYQSWKFKHPEPVDFIRVMEKTSGLQLRWYMSYWVNTTKKIDYGIKSVFEKNDETLLTLERVGDFPMPVDVLITYKDGSKEILYIPTNETLGNKPNDEPATRRIIAKAWPWVNPIYTAKISKRLTEIAIIEIDPSMRMADVERKNNKLETSILQSFDDLNK